MEVTIYSASMIHTFNQNPYRIETTNEYLLREFDKQVRNKGSAITVGYVGGLLKYTAEKTRWEQSTVGNPQLLKIYKSKTNPNIQILATDILIDMYENTMYPYIVKKFPDIRLLIHMLQFMRKDLFENFDLDELLACFKIVKDTVEWPHVNRIDFVKLSTDIPFHCGVELDN